MLYEMPCLEWQGQGAVSLTKHQGRGERYEHGNPGPVDCFGVKPLIAKAVAQMDIVQNAKQNGILVVRGGTTNSYLAEELLGHGIDKRAFRYSVSVPSNPEKQGGPEPKGPKDLIFRNGKLDETMDRMAAMPEEEFYELTDAEPTLADLRPKPSALRCAQDRLLRGSARRLRAWEELYNRVRPHQALGYKTPLEFLQARRQYQPRREGCTGGTERVRRLAQHGRIV